MSRVRRACCREGCNYLQHSLRDFGGHCCWRCSEGTGHGNACERETVAAHTPDASCIPVQSAGSSSASGQQSHTSDAIEVLHIRMDGQSYYAVMCLDEKSEPFPQAATFRQLVTTDFEREDVNTGALRDALCNHAPFMQHRYFLAAIDRANNLFAVGVGSSKKKRERAADLGLCLAGNLSSSCPEFDALAESFTIKRKWVQTKAAPRRLAQPPPQKALAAPCNASGPAASSEPQTVARDSQSSWDWSDSWWEWKGASEWNERGEGGRAWPACRDESASGDDDGSNDDEDEWGAWDGQSDAQTPPGEENAELPDTGNVCASPPDVRYTGSRPTCGDATLMDVPPRLKASCKFRAAPRSQPPADSSCDSLSDILRSVGMTPANIALIMEKECSPSVEDFADNVENEEDAKKWALEIGFSGRTMQNRFVKAWRMSKAALGVRLPPAGAPPEDLRHIKQEKEEGNNIVLSDEEIDDDIASASKDDAEPDIKHIDGSYEIVAPLSRVRYTQAKISNYFTDGRSLQPLIHGIVHNADEILELDFMRLEAVGKIIDGRMFYLCNDNRRLYCLKEAQRRMGEQLKVRLKVVDLPPGPLRRFVQHYDTSNGGCGVSIRDNPKRQRWR